MLIRLSYESRCPGGKRFRGKRMIFPLFDQVDLGGWKDPHRETRVAVNIKGQAPGMI